MQSLFEAYSEIKESYYHIQCDAKDLFTCDAASSQKNCFGFLDAHYQLGHKKELFDNDLLNPNKRHGKHIHSVSLYLLGMTLIPTFKKHISEKMRKFVPHFTQLYKSDYDFWHIWYLTSMYHDYASCAELGTIQENDSEQHRSLNYHLGNHNIFYSPYMDFPYKMCDIPFRFSPKLIENYFYYRACRGNCEHGIIAGYLFFDRFVKNFLSNTEGLFENGQYSIIRYGLNWDIGYLAVAAYVADAIICHNIWLGGTTEKNEYTQYGLTPLLYDDHKESKLSLEKYPLQFMLCLLDTIEPIKRFGGSLSPREILDKISVCCPSNSSSSLSISWSNTIVQHEKFKNWRHGIIDLQNWMDVSVAQGGNYVEINFR